MTISDLDMLRREAKRLAKSHARGDADALALLGAVVKGDAPRHADFLHVIARQRGYATWPALKEAVELSGLARAEALARLRLALYLGQEGVVTHLLAETPDLAEGHFVAQVALLNLAAVRGALATDPGLATTPVSARSPMLHLAFSKAHSWTENGGSTSVQIAELLLAAGADVHDAWIWEDGSPLSALYGALGHADNMALAGWLLEKGADPNDNESLYHATELGHHDGLDLLLKHGAKVDGTNALLRAMDFNDHVAVRKLLAAGGSPDVGERGSLAHGALRGNDPEMARVLLEAGADPNLMTDGMTARDLALIYGNLDYAEALGDTQPNPEVAQLVALARGEPIDGYIDPAKLPFKPGDFLANLIGLPGRFDYIRRLIAAGLPWDAPDYQGLTPVQMAGWHGIPEIMSFFLEMSPDLSHINGYGGTLLSTIIHGSENAPPRDGQDHLACLEAVLHQGVALPKRAISAAGRDDVRKLLESWAEAHPGQVVEHGIA